LALCPLLPLAHADETPGTARNPTRADANEPPKPTTKLASQNPRRRISTAIARRVNKTPAQVLLAWAIQRGTALLTTSKTPSRIKENFDVSTLPEEAVREISEGIKQRVRFNAVVETGIPGFIPREKEG
jgi:diketogulonate reductase-like aldo/keto reductase